MPVVRSLFNDFKHFLLQIFTWRLPLLFQCLKIFRVECWIWNLFDHSKSALVKRSHEHFSILSFEYILLLLLSCRKKKYFLSFIKWFCTEPYHPNGPYTIEYTIYNILYIFFSCSLFLSLQILVAACCVFYHHFHFSLVFSHSTRIY